MGLKRESKTIKYTGFRPGTKLSAIDADDAFGYSTPVTVIKHRAVVHVKYLVEMDDGSRRWVEECDEEDERRHDEPDDEEDVLLDIRTKRKGKQR